MTSKEKEYEKYCKNKKIETLTMPFVRMKISISLPIKKLVIHTDKKDKKDQKFNLIKKEFKNDKKEIYFDFNNYILKNTMYAFSPDSTLQTIGNIVDYKWFKSNNEFILGLDIKQLQILRSYTFLGDKVVRMYNKGDFSKLKTYLQSILDNEFLKSKSYFPLLHQTFDFIKNQEAIIEKTIGEEDYEKKYNIICAIFKDLNDENVKSIIKNYIGDINNIINSENNIQIQNEFVVYHGINSKNVLHSKTDEYKPETLISTSLNIHHNVIFKNSQSIKRITLLQGTKALYLGGISHKRGENIILLGKNTTFTGMDSVSQMRYKNTTSNSTCTTNINIHDIKAK